MSRARSVSSKRTNGCAGRLNWPWAWVYLRLSLATVLINGTIMLRTSPETLAERGRPKEMKDWDKAELPGYRGYTREVRYRLVPGIW